MSEAGHHFAAADEPDAGGDGHQEYDAPEDPRGALECRIDFGLEVGVEGALFGHIDSIGAGGGGIEGGSTLALLNAGCRLKNRGGASGKARRLCPGVFWKCASGDWFRCRASRNMRFG